VSIKLEAGKYYKNRIGKVCGPLIKLSDFSDYDYEDTDYRTYMKSGSYYATDGIHNFDLLEECTKFEQSVVPTNTQPRISPIGLIPQNIFLELQNKQRVQDILDACSRYNEANKDIPQEWIDELSSRRGVDVLDPKSEPHETEKPAYMKDFEYNGEVYSVEFDEDSSCSGCEFENKACTLFNSVFEDARGLRCSSTSKPIKFVKKA
jgi:hypothetical protein